MRQVLYAATIALCLIGSPAAATDADGTRYQVFYSPYWFYAYGGAGATDIPARSHIVTHEEAPVFAKFVAKIHRNLEDELPFCPAFISVPVKITYPGTVISIYPAGFAQINGTCHRFAKWKIRHMEPFLNHLTSQARQVE